MNMHPSVTGIDNSGPPPEMEVAEAAHAVESELLSWSPGSPRRLELEAMEARLKDPAITRVETRRLRRLADALASIRLRGGNAGRIA